MNRKKILLFGGVIVFILVLIDLVSTSRFCTFFYGEGANICIRRVFNAGVILLPFIPAFVFSLITYFLKEGVFRAWFYFACVWIPLSMIAVFMVPESSGGLFANAFSKHMISFMLSIIFSIISLCIILTQSWRLRGK